MRPRCDREQYQQLTCVVTIAGDGAMLAAIYVLIYSRYCREGQLDRRRAICESTTERKAVPQAESCGVGQAQASSLVMACKQQEHQNTTHAGDDVMARHQGFPCNRSLISPGSLDRKLRDYRIKQYPQVPAYLRLVAEDRTCGVHVGIVRSCPHTTTT